MLIRQAKLSDCKNLAALSIQVWLSAYARDGINTVVSNYVLDTFNEQHFHELLKKDHYQIYTFTEQEHLLGFIAINLSSHFETPVNGFEIDTLYVQDRQQGKGVGQKLLRKVGELHQPNYWLTTWSHNIEGISFYQHLGFKDIGVSYFELDGEQHENRVLAFKGGVINE